MTLATVWRTGDRLMAIADTRIIREANNVLTEHGPKLLPVTVVSRQPSKTGHFDQISFRTNIGFAYSGSTLAALCTHSMSSVLLSNLICAQGVPPPSLRDLALSVRNVADGYMREIAQLSGISGLFSAIVFGYCQVARNFCGFEIRPRLEEAVFSCDLIELDFREQDSIAIIGSCPDLLRQRIDADRSATEQRGDSHPVLAIDRPTRALQAIIDDGMDERVGGAIQQGWATVSGFEIAAKLLPITPRPPSPRNAGLFVLGFDVMDIQDVGYHRVMLGGR